MKQNNHTGCFLVVKVHVYFAIFVLTGLDYRGPSNGYNKAENKQNGHSVFSNCQGLHLAAIFILTGLTAEEFLVLSLLACVYKFKNEAGIDKKY